jgi:hypothetical protein
MGGFGVLGKKLHNCLIIIGTCAHKLRRTAAGAEGINLSCISLSIKEPKGKFNMIFLLDVLTNTMGRKLS